MPGTMNGFEIKNQTSKNMNAEEKRILISLWGDHSKIQFYKNIQVVIAHIIEQM
jgi:hypothetical protein